jgi:hypothetical protein
MYLFKNYEKKILAALGHHTPVLLPVVYHKYISCK